MRNLGIIGTNWITQQFVAAAKESETFKLTHVYSRTEEKANEFAKEAGTVANISTDVEEFFSSDDFDTVYIASPNSLHFEYTKKAIQHGKNIIVEKPSFSNRKEFAEIEKMLQDSDVYFFEAARHIHEDSFNKIKEYIDQHRQELSGASLDYMKYSSRYDLVLDGQEPNIFSLKFSAGALYDLGVYTIYDAIVWFGTPEEVHYQPEIIATGADGSGVATLKYEKFDVNIIFGKTKNSYIKSEIYFGKNTLQFDNAGTIEEVTRYEDDKVIPVDINVQDNPMVEEAKAFYDIMENNDRDKFKELFGYAKEVNEVLNKLREDAGIIFAAD
ncbi:oxidoreductase [Companilactobacillus sp. RD055328]|uniref:Gfo/Idh/MocA family protein n=1 Tax=Companilactobacillus sp. RD055328 TaxID=2916634 RepID=UPI001FC7FB5A|nr:Gfo/Idh/MocA family oxidoreductase [Companilactobacillus sp. RD055328]GKQ43123.1 oxidoreductase [Companilactobacillus sp. RD055328]